MTYRARPEAQTQAQHQPQQCVDSVHSHKSFFAGKGAPTRSIQHRKSCLGTPHPKPLSPPFRLQMFADLVHLQSLVPMPGTNFEGYTNTDGQYFDGGRDGFDINTEGGRSAALSLFFGCTCVEGGMENILCTG